MASVAGPRPACGVHPSGFVVRCPAVQPSGVQPVRCPVTWFVVRGLAVQPSGGHPSSVRPCGVHLSSVQPSGVRPRPSGRARLLPPQAVALGTRWGRRGNLHHGNGSRSRGGRAVERLGQRAEAWMTRATLPRSRVGRWGVGGGPGRVRRGRWRPRLPAARPGRPGRRAERPWLAAALWARSRLQREVAAPVAWLPSWAVRDHGAWLSWRLRSGWTGPAGPMGLPAGMDVRPRRGPGWRRAFPARCPQRSDLRGWGVGLPGLGPGTSSLSAIGGSPLCNPAFLQVAGDRRG